MPFEPDLFGPGLRRRTHLTGRILPGRTMGDLPRLYIVECLERRRLFAGDLIINDAFTDGPAYSGENISGRTPTATDLPASVYQVAAGYDYDQQVLGSNNGSYSNAAAFHNFGAAAISLAGNGSYVEPVILQVSAQIAFETSSGYVSNAYLGFYSSVFSNFISNDLLNFSGLQLNTNGNLALINNGVSSKTIPFTGVYTSSGYSVLTYDVNTAIGSIYGVTLTGSTSDYTQFASSSFNPAATVYGGIGGDNDPARVHFMNYQVASMAQVVPSISINAGASLVESTPDIHAHRTVTVVTNLTIASSGGAWTGKLDLTANDLIVHNGNLPLLSNQIQSGFNMAVNSWSGEGITSSTAASDSTHLTAIGIELNNDGDNQVQYGSGAKLGLFDGQATVLSDVLIKYTYYGDANLDGKVDGSDYTKIDSGYLNRLSGWSNGDFNYDSVINGSDYTLIDNAFNTQQAALSEPIPTPTQLLFGQQPTNAYAGANITPAITVDTDDASGKPVVSYASTVTLALASGSGTLSGTTTATTVNGVATFADLSIAATGAYTLKATDIGLATVTSSSFSIITADGGLSNSDPFGVAASSQSTSDYSAWAPTVAAAGVKWARLFPVWNTVEPSQGNYDWSSVDSVTSTALANGQYVSGIFFYNASWVNSDQGTFPTDNLSAWSSYVSALTAHTTGKVEYWEVWNEPQNVDGGGTAADYANTVVAAYNAAKAADPDAKIGLDVASVDINYLENVINAGAADHFDYITVHPYEVLGAVDQGWEGDYMSIVPSIRKMLTADDPAKANVPIWFTEMGEQLGFVAGPVSVTATSQAQDLVKAYSMGIAEGVARMNWYEGEDGDTGFGLLDSSGNPRSAYTAMQSLTTYLGATPQYQGWVQLNDNDYGFVFQGATTSVMVAWAQPNATDHVSFSSATQIDNPLTLGLSNLSAGSTLALTNSPMFVVGVPSDILMQAQADKSQAFPWGGNYSNASSVSIQLGTSNIDSGLHQLSPDQTSTAVSAYGGPARASHDNYSDIYQSFEVDPNFISYSPLIINITVVARRNTANDAASFTLDYESTTGLKQAASSTIWVIPGNDQWYSHTFTLTDAEFNSKWGYNFALDSSSSNNMFYLQSIAVTKG